MSEESSDWGPGTADLSQERREAREQAESDNDDEEGAEPSESEESPEEQSEAPEQKTTLGEFEAPEDQAGNSVYDAMRRGEYGFLPVFGFNESNIAARKYARDRGIEDDDTVINQRDDEPLMIGGKELTWWEDESIMPKHPMMLVNPLGFASVDPDVHNFREVFRCEKGNQFVFSDSGGYQIMSMDEAEIVDSIEDHQFTDYRIYPEELLTWQTQNADAGATIDYPPYNISGDSNFPDKMEYNQEWMDFFVKRKYQSGEMTGRMAARLRELRDEGDAHAEDFIFSPVIHGKPHPDETHKLVSDWHNEMEVSANENGIEPRGWVLKPEPASNFGQIALMLGYAAEHLQDADYIHVLMVGGLLQKALLIYYAKNSDHFVTSDASSYAAGGKRRQFDLPKTATRRSVIISDRDEEDDNAAMNQNKLNRYPCRCAVCSTVENDVGFEFVSEGSGSARSVSLNLHNLHQILTVERTFDALLREEEADIVETHGDPTGCEFWRYLSSMAQDRRIEDLYKAMDYVRIAQEESLEAANDTYRIKWSKQDGSTIDFGGDGASQFEF